jgi:3-hydroxyisobutyrate dehydrogenase-like beta-hydroxyacid dehydrogenase
MRAEAGEIAAETPRDVAEEAKILITSLPITGTLEQAMAGQGGIARATARLDVVEADRAHSSGACKAQCGLLAGNPEFEMARRC